MLLLINPQHLLAQELPPGWRQQIGHKNTIIYQPINAGGNLDIQVKYYPSVPLEQNDIGDWLRKKLTFSKAPVGEWQGKMKYTRSTANIATGSRSFKKADGNIGHIEVMAVSLDRQNVRLAAMVYSDNPANQPYLNQIKPLFTNIIKLEKEKILKQGGKLRMETRPPKVKEINPGGPIQPGRYVGSRIKHNEVWSHYDIMLYANGEYEYLDEEDKSGRYLYSQETGRLNITDGFYNYKEDFCVYGLNKKTGKQTIYAEDDGYKYRLNWIRSIDRLAPSQRKWIDTLKKHRKKRYKYVTEPGNGISPDQIETVLYTFHFHYGGGGMVIDEAAYLLTTDGRVMKDIPVALNRLDVAKSQSREPERWGWWQHDGEQYRFAWEIDRAEYTLPVGEQMKASPIPAGTHLDGDFTTSSSYSNFFSSRSSFWGVILSKDGRFLEHSRSMMQSGGEMMGNGPLATAISSDEGTSVSIIGSVAGGGSSTKSKRSKSHREGTYEFNGYNLTLKYDDGRVKHLLTFSTTDKLDDIWYDGDLFSLREDD
jgi:hypothetical protein